MEAESVTFNGIVFRRYPDSERWADRAYFTPNGSHRKRGVGRLHEEIWKSIHGPIPPGHHIHHSDGDHLNNDPTNLECITKADHHKHHGAQPASPRKRAHLDRIRPLAADWHRSEEGRAWHSEHGKATWQNRQTTERICEQCGSTYQSITMRGADRFCSNKCKSAWRRSAGLDNETRTCAHCGQPFTVNRYSRARTCSGKCAWGIRRIR
jgi:endogenous inhibitor of DNA gyrase (YacG/DUF329 family)